ncbi:MAG TPA: hypothetical protein VLD57_10710 [Blastocatellia bacterium]|nr:hypothetical protein [Blastocatellia bacterium]
MVTPVLLLLLSPLFFPVAQEHTPPGDAAPPIQVLKNSWSKFRYRPGWDSQTHPNQGGSPSTNPNTIPRPNRRRLGRVIEGFAYKATLKNLSQRTITLVVWEYTFADPEGRDETHHEFFSRIRIKPGEKKEVMKYVAEPPTRTVSASGAGRQMKEEVRIKYVEFEDGSSWGTRKEVERGDQEMEPGTISRPILY